MCLNRKENKKIIIVYIPSFACRCITTTADGFLLLWLLLWVIGWVLVWVFLWAIPWLIIPVMLGVLLPVLLWVMFWPFLWLLSGLNIAMRHVLFLKSDLIIHSLFLFANAHSATLKSRSRNLSYSLQYHIAITHSSAKQFISSPKYTHATKTLALYLFLEEHCATCIKRLTKH